MTTTKINHLKEFAHDVLKQQKHWTKRIKKTTLYKDNKPLYYNRKTGEYKFVPSKHLTK
jgi:hypothetical protein